MRGVHPAKRTVFIKLQFIWSIPLIFGGRIITTLTRGACKSDNVSHFNRVPIQKISLPSLKH